MVVVVALALVAPVVVDHVYTAAPHQLPEVLERGVVETNNLVAHRSMALLKVALLGEMHQMDYSRWEVEVETRQVMTGGLEAGLL
jgi:hypothetical protein